MACGLQVSRALTSVLRNSSAVVMPQIRKGHMPSRGPCAICMELFTQLACGLRAAPSSYVSIYCLRMQIHIHMTHTHAHAHTIYIYTRMHIVFAPS